MLKIQRENLEFPGNAKTRARFEGREEKPVRPDVLSSSSDHLSRQAKLLQKVETEISRLKNSGANVSKAEFSLASARRALESGDQAKAENFVARAGLEIKRSASSSPDTPPPRPSEESSQETQTFESARQDNLTGPNETTLKTPQGDVPRGGLKSLSAVIKEKNSEKTASNPAETTGFQKDKPSEAKSRLDFRGQTALARLDAAAGNQRTIDATLRREEGKSSPEILAHLSGRAGSGSISVNSGGSYGFTPGSPDLASFPTALGSTGFEGRAYLRIGTGENSGVQSLAQIGVTASPAESFSETSLLAVSENSEPETDQTPANPASSIAEVPTMADLSETAGSEPLTTTSASSESALTDDGSVSPNRGNAFGAMRLRGLFRRAFNAYSRTLDSGSVRINYTA